MCRQQETWKIWRSGLIPSRKTWAQGINYDITPCLTNIVLRYFLGALYCVIYSIPFVEAQLMGVHWNISYLGGNYSSIKCPVVFLINRRMSPHAFDAVWNTLYRVMSMWYPIPKGKLFMYCTFSYGLF